MMNKVPLIEILNQAEKQYLTDHPEISEFIRHYVKGEEATALLPHKGAKYAKVFRTIPGQHWRIYLDKDFKPVKITVQQERKVFCKRRSLKDCEYSSRDFCPSCFTGRREE